MEIKLDIGKNIHDKLNEFSEIDKKDYESFAIEMLSIGLQIFENSLKSSGEVDKSVEYKILQKAIENNLINRELTHFVFERSKCKSKIFDPDSLIKTCELNAESYIKGLLSDSGL